MKVRIHFKDGTNTTFNNVTRLGLMKHMYNGKYTRLMYFCDAERGLFQFALTDIVEMVTD